MKATIFRRLCAGLALAALLTAQAFAAPASDTAANAAPASDTAASAADDAAAQAVERLDAAIEIINENALFAAEKPVTAAERAEMEKAVTADPSSLADELNRLLVGRDSHSYYMTAAQYAAAFPTLSSRYSGVGISLRRTVRGFEVGPVGVQTPAGRAGIRQGDLLVAVDEVRLGGKSLDEVAGMLRGEEGTAVTLTLARDRKTFDAALVRTGVYTCNVYYEEAAPGVGCIQILSFSSMADAADFAAAWKQLQEDGCETLVLDLRDNGGGLLNAAYTMLNVMLPEAGTVAYEDWREALGGRQEVKVEGGAAPLEKIVVLVNGNTASAAELMAAVLREQADAVLVGDRTYGKSRGQLHLATEEGDMLVLTCLEMSLPHTAPWEGKGLAPDVQSPTARPVEGVLADAPALDLWTPVRPGDSGTQVAALTARLYASGLLAETTDVWDAEVTHAVQVFQDAAGLLPIGYADLETLRRLDESCVQAAAQGALVDVTWYAGLTLCQQAMQSSDAAA